MAYPPYLREKARDLRRERRLTIDELAERLALSRSTIYYWVRDLPIPTSGSGGGWPESAQRLGTKAMQAKYRSAREAAYARGQASFDELAADPEFRAFVCLYIAEGYKRTRNVVSLANSDPAVIKVADRWIRRFARNPVTYHVQFHADQQLSELAAFWSEQLGVPPAAITFQRKSNSGRLAKRTWRSRDGVLTVKAHDTRFRAELEAWMDRLRAEWD